MKLKDYLKFREITRNQMAKECGINQQTLYNIIKGKPVRLKTAAVIVAYTKGKIWYTDMLPTRDRTKLSPLLSGLNEERA